MMRQRRTGRGLLAAAVLLAALFVWQENGSWQKEEESFPAVAWITALEQKDTKTVKSELNARDEAERKQALADSAALTGTGEAGADGGAEEKPTDRESLKKRFGQSVIVGDSVAEGFIDYEILDPSSIVAQKGLRAAPGAGAGSPGLCERDYAGTACRGGKETGIRVCG